MICQEILPHAQGGSGKPSDDEQHHTSSDDEVSVCVMSLMCFTACVCSLLRTIEIAWFVPDVPTHVLTYVVWDLGFQEHLQKIHEELGIETGDDHAAGAQT
jgi:hypothetical protein